MRGSQCLGFGRMRRVTSLDPVENKDFHCCVSFRPFLFCEETELHSFIETPANFEFSIEAEGT